MGWFRVAAIAAALYFLFLGGSDVGAISTPTQILNAIFGGALVLLLAQRLGSDHDATDVLALATFGAVVVSTALSPLPRFALGAAIAAVAWLAVFYHLRRALADVEFRRAAVRLLGIAGAVAAITVILLWGTHWLAWISIEGSGAPPLDMRLPVGGYRHHRVVAMLIVLLLPAIWALPSHGAFTVIRTIGMGAGAAVVVMSGARSIWLAIVVATVVVTVMSSGVLVAGRRRIIGAIAALAGVVALAALTGIAGALVDRLLTLATLFARWEIWSHTLATFAERPVSGSGLGTFAPMLALSGYYDQNGWTPRHADNAYIQAAAEGGVLLLVCLVAFAVYTVVGMRRRGVASGAATWALVVFAVMSLMDNPADTASLCLVGLFWLALLSPPAAGAWRHTSGSKSRRYATLAVLGGVGLLVASTQAATVAFEIAKADARRGSLSAAIPRLELAVALDPGMAFYWRQLGTVRLQLGDARGLADVRRALMLNPADDTAARVLAWAYKDEPAGRRWSEFAVRIRGTSPENLLTAWLLTKEHRYLERAVWIYPWLPAAGSLATLAEDHQLTPEWEITRSRARDQYDERVQSELAAAWTHVVDGQVSADDPPQFHALAALFECDVATAEALMRDAADPSVVWVVIERALGLEYGPNLRRHHLYSHGEALLAVRPEPPVPAGTGRTHDRVYYLRIPGELDGSGPHLPTSSVGLSHWMREPDAAASRSDITWAYPACEEAR